MSVRFGGKLDTYQTLLALEGRLNFGLFVWNIDTDEMQWSEGMFALLGLKPGSEQPSTALIQAMTHPDDRVSPNWLRHEIREGRLLDRDFRALLRDGRVRHISQRAWLTQGDGNSKQITGVCTDVTSLFEANARWQMVQRRFTTLVNAASCMVWTAPPDADGLHAINLLAAEPLSFRGDWLDHVPVDDKTALLTKWSLAVTAREPFKSLHRLATPQCGLRWHQSHAVPLMDRDFSVVEWIGATIDVHDLVASHQTPRKITGAQIRGGRGILNWSVRDLADATGITAAIARRLEEFDGIPSGYDEALSSVLRTMEGAGIEFLTLPDGKPAVRPR